MTKELITFKQACPTLDITFELINKNNSFFPDALIIKVNGEYRNGSAGDDDAKLIRGTLNTAVDIWRPATVLLDLSDFKYDWGDYIEIIFDRLDQQKPFAIIVGQKCRQALSTLVHGLDTEKDIVDNELFFDSIDKALEKLK